MKSASLTLLLLLLLMTHGVNSAVERKCDRSEVKFEQFVYPGTGKKDNPTTGWKE